MIDLTPPWQLSIPSPTALSPTKGSILSGKHAEPETRPAQRGFSTRITRLIRFLPRRSIPIIAAGTIAVIVVVAAAAAMTMGPVTDTPVAAHVEVTTAGPAPVASRTTDGDRASRSELRADPGPLPSPSSVAPSSPAAPSKKATSTASQPSGGGTVTSTSDCQASYYGTGTTNADGEPFDPKAFTAAHRTLPFHTRVRVTNKANGKSVVVEIKDRGPYVSGRCIDLTTAAFQAIASLGAGVASVHLEVLA